MQANLEKYIDFLFTINKSVVMYNRSHMNIAVIPARENYGNTANNLWKVRFLIAICCIIRNKSFIYLDFL